MLTLKDLESKKDSSSVNNKDKSNNTSLYWGIGIVGIFLIFGFLIMVRIRKKKKC